MQVRNRFDRLLRHRDEIVCSKRLAARATAAAAGSTRLFSAVAPLLLVADATTRLKKTLEEAEAAGVAIGDEGKIL